MKKVGVVSSETKEKIVMSAKKEFSEKGYSASSLRTIAAHAGVTTGAIYFFFKGKDDLFASVVNEIMEPVKEYVTEYFEKEKNIVESGVGCEEESDLSFADFLINSYISNSVTWKILLTHINHPVVQSFINGYIKIASDHYKYILDKASEMYNKKVVGGAFGIHAFINMQVHTLITLANHKFSPEQMRDNIKLVAKMLRGSFCALLSD